MKKNTNVLFTQDDFESAVPVNWGRLLENDLKKWKGGSQHIRGIGEYITNSDDSYRRLKKFSNQDIYVEIYSDRKNGKQIDKVIIRDQAEGMSRNDLDEKFFKYFESHSGRETGQNVSGQFGTGGKAYAIMNFKECFITSVRKNKENKAWFKWDDKRKLIVKGYNEKGYSNKEVNKPNGTIVELHKTENKVNLVDFVFKLNELARIRHVIKSQNIYVSIFQGKQEPQQLKLEYDPPRKYDDIWKFELPKNLKNKKDLTNEFVLRYFEKPLDKEFLIDVSDGISTVADLDITRYDGRPFSKYLNGEITIEKLQNSSAVKENRKGLEEGDDLTVEIEEFITDKIKIVINEIQERQSKKERERNIQTSNKKIKELNKFLKKCELNFNNEISSLLKRTGKNNLEATNVESETTGTGFSKPDGTDGDINGEWTKGDGERKKGEEENTNKFNPDESGEDKASLDKNKPLQPQENKKQKRGLKVIMTDDDDSPVSPDEYGEFEEPVIDKYLKSDGIILINANNPIIANSRIHKQLQHIFNERVANYVLLVVSQYLAQKELDLQPEDERPDPMLTFRQRFFKLQRELRDDTEVNYYEEEMIDK